MFRALLFEAEAERFRTAGIRLGADQTDVELKLLGEILAPFPVGLRNQAMRMTRVYALMHCFESSVRQLVRDRLEERYGIDWWEKGVPKKIRDFAEQRRSTAVQNSWLEGEKGDHLHFVEFGHLADIIIHSWDDFTDLIPSQHWVKQRMDDLEQARNFLAHNRMLLPSEFQRIEMYVGDWNRQVGV